MHVQSCGRSSRQLSWPRARSANDPSFEATLEVHRVPTVPGFGFFFLNGLGMGVDVEKIIPNWGMMNKNVELQIIEKMAHSF